ncbi:Ribosome biogenesis regulatory protein-like [Oopsacas minuta]|uniref:Ribosome biogenesis regulatory protein n=1 Tax=Oopsacas minuta TaxID=111878 RepID=A0AAV7JNL0_9METZ|nr:Ribosome biogenesis regulatory protein-like [Oopsacas minuta]
MASTTCPHVTNRGLEMDLGNLMATDIDFHLTNEGENGHLSVVKLPEPKTQLPRFQPLPQPKPLTRWERYSKAKGVSNKKRSRMVWDERGQEWKPRWGYKKASKRPEDQWLVEIPDQKDPYEDYFEKAKEEKRERVAKNEYQRVRNLMRDHEGKIKAPHLLTNKGQKGGKKELNMMTNLAKVSTPSLGKFSEKVKGEPKSIRGQKRMFDPVLGDLKSEREKQLKLLETISRDKPIVNVSKAVNRFIDKKQKSL